MYLKEPSNNLTFQDYKRFIDKNTNWVHVDLMAWNTSSRPGFPIGGEAMGLRSIVNMIIKYCSKS